MTEITLNVGDQVRVKALPPYVKTADTMPMLRPPDTIAVGEIGLVIDQRPGGFWGVRLKQGTFLLDQQYLEPVTDAETIEVSESIETENPNAAL